MGNSRWVHLDFEEIINGSEKALLIRFGEDCEHWIPLSQVADPDDYQVGDLDGTISVTEWIAKEKGLEEF